MLDKTIETETGIDTTELDLDKAHIDNTPMLIDYLAKYEAASKAYDEYEIAFKALAEAGKKATLILDSYTEGISRNFKELQLYKK